MTCARGTCAAPMREIIVAPTWELYECLNGHSLRLGASPFDRREREAVPPPDVRSNKLPPIPRGVTCGWCAASRDNGHGPCVRHGGLSTKARQRMRQTAWERRVRRVR